MNMGAKQTKKEIIKLTNEQALSEYNDTEDLYISESTVYRSYDNIESHVNRVYKKNSLSIKYIELYTEDYNRLNIETLWIQVAPKGEGDYQLFYSGPFDLLRNLSKIKQIGNRTIIEIPKKEIADIPFQKIYISLFSSEHRINCPFKVIFTNPISNDLSNEYQILKIDNKKMVSTEFEKTSKIYLKCPKIDHFNISINDKPYKGNIKDLTESSEHDKFHLYLISLDDTIEWNTYKMICKDSRIVKTNEKIDFRFENPINGTIFIPIKSKKFSYYYSSWDP